MTGCQLLVLSISLSTSKRCDGSILCSEYTEQDTKLMAMRYSNYDRVSLPFNKNALIDNSRSDKYDCSVAGFAATF